MNDITVKLDINQAPRWAIYDFESWVVLKLEEAGVPVTDGLLTKKIDFSKGVLSAREDPATTKMLYHWRFIE